MSVSSNPASLKNLVAKAYITVDSKDFIDYTAGTVPRGRSGVLKTSVTDVTVTGGITGEKLAVFVRPPNQDDAHNDKVELHVAVTGSPQSVGGFGTTPYTHTTDWNYGQPDASAKVLPDGTIVVGVVEVHLPDDTAVDPATPLTAAVTVSMAWTEISPYSTFSGATSGSLSLSCAPQEPADWGAITSSYAPADGYVAIQFSSVVSTVTPQSCDCSDGCRCSSPPVLAVARQGDMILSSAVPPGTGMTKGLVQSYTRVYAINGGKFGPSAPRMNRAPIGGTPATEYVLANVGLQRDPRNPGDAKVDATLNYLSLQGAV